jgi:cob(I)alamin adenosyltransferase
MKLYTRAGDEGFTGLYGGDRVTKAHPRLMAYGTLDELNSLVGMLRLYASAGAGAAPALERVQHDLFVLGAILATPPSALKRLDEKMARPTWAIPDMEADIDRLSALAPPMRNFVLPGGSPGAAWAHLARTVCRRAEREVAALDAAEPVEPAVRVYLNRLSDWFFALARAENAASGVADVEWVAK